MDNYYFHMDNLSVGYNRKALIHDICIGIKKGEIVNNQKQKEGKMIFLFLSRKNLTAMRLYM